MKISINDQEVFTLTEIQKQVIANDIPLDALEDDLKRRVVWRVDKNMNILCRIFIAEWLPKLKEAGMQNKPKTMDDLITAVKAHIDYKDMDKRLSER